MSRSTYPYHLVLTVILHRKPKRVIAVHLERLREGTVASRHDGHGERWSVVGILGQSSVDEVHVGKLVVFAGCESDLYLLSVFLVFPEVEHGVLRYECGLEAEVMLSSLVLSVDSSERRK